MDYVTKGLPEMGGRPAAGGTQAVARAAALLRAIAASRHASASLAELAAEVGLERPTAYRILQRLALEGLVTQDPASRAYGLGPLLYELGLAAQAPLGLAGAAREALDRLAQSSGDTVFAIVRNGLDSVCLDRREGDYPVKALMMDAGRRRPLGIGAGSLAWLAAMPQEHVAPILQANAGRIRAAGEADLQALAHQIDTCRAQDFALRTATEAPEIVSLAVVARNVYGTPVLALSISALRFRIEQRQDLLLGQLRAARAQLEQRLRSAT